MSCVRISEANFGLTKMITVEGISPQNVNSLAKHTREKHVCVKMFLFHSFVFNFWERGHVFRSWVYLILPWLLAWETSIFF